MKIRICPKCGSRNLETAGYCANQLCGGALSVDNIVELDDDIVNLIFDNPESPPPINEQPIQRTAILKNPVVPVVQTPVGGSPPPASAWARLGPSCLVFWLVSACLLNVLIALMAGNNGYNIGYFLIGTLCAPIVVGPIWALGYLWIWPLVDCIKNEPSGGNERIFWFLVIFFTNFLGGILYLFARRPERIRLYGK